MTIFMIRKHTISLWKLGKTKKEIKIAHDPSTQREIKVNIFLKLSIIGGDNG